jgi:hypothetical protein
MEPAYVVIASAIRNQRLAAPLIVAAAYLVSHIGTKSHQNG